MIQRLKEYVRGILLLDRSPHRVALAFAIGVFIAFTPHIGFHTVSAVGIAWLFRLSLPIMLMGTFVNNPWTIIPMYGFCLCLGNKLLGNGFNCLPPGFSRVELIAFLTNSPIPFVVGTLTMGAVASIVSYFGLRRALFLMRFKDKSDRIEINREL